jgi:1,4-alpha-glucan branching enzyme
MLDSAEIIALCRAEHGDPYAVLGMHTDADGGLWVRSLQPGALAVAVLDAKTGKQVAELEEREIEGVEGFFEGVMPRRRNVFPTACASPGQDGVQETDDPYRFWTVLGEMDVWLLAEGSHLRPFERLGAHLCEIDGVAGTAFAVWAPDAQRVSVVGDFNTWDGRRHPMRLRRECGVWEIFLPGVSAGAHYKYEIRSRDGYLLPLKADPYGFQAEMRPSTASIVCALPNPSNRRRPGRRRARRADVGLRGAPGFLAAGRRWRLSRLAAAQRNADPLRRRPRLHASRAAADFRAPLRRLLGLPAARSVLPDRPPWRPGRFPRLRRFLPRRRVCA